MTISLYIHIPFCQSRCSYCAFSSSIINDETVDRYLVTLSQEIQRRARNYAYHTIYCGGGTPTCLNEKALGKLLGLFTSLKFSDNYEFTFEANPGTLNYQKLSMLRQAGVNRLSLGAQTFDPQGLEILGRKHSAAETHRAVEMSCAAGLENISFDLIYGWAGQTAASWENDMRQILKLNVNHVSAYSLSYELDTPLDVKVKNGEIQKLDEDSERNLFDQTGEFFTEAGLPRYEISNFARSEFESRHNINYWQGGEYVGVGAAAHSHLSGRRFANAFDVEEYIELMREQDTAEVFSEQLLPEKHARECAVIWLRMSQGINCEKFHRKTGFKLTELFQSELEKLLSDNLLTWSEDESFLRLTESALPITDAILAELV